MPEVLTIPQTAMEVFEMLPEGTRCEVIDSALYMSPSPTTDHQRLSLRIANKIYNFLIDNPLGEVFAAPCGVYLNAGGENVVEPDILFVKSERGSIIEKKGIIGAPDLIIEILSSNMKHDKVTKLELYQRNAVPEYFIIDPDTKQVWHYMLVADAYVLHNDKQVGILNIKQLDLQINF